MHEGVVAPRSRWLVNCICPVVCDVLAEAKAEEPTKAGMGRLGAEERQSKSPPLILQTNTNEADKVLLTPSL